jgi:hypothetical protein
MIAKAFSEIDSSKGPLANFLLGFEELVKVPLVNLLFQLQAPNLNNGRMRSDQSKLLTAFFSLKLEGNWNANVFLTLYYGTNYEYGFIDDFELDREGQPAVVRGDLGAGVSVEKQVMVSEGELDLLLIADKDIFQLWSI